MKECTNNDFVKAITNKSNRNTKSSQAIYVDKNTGEIKITAEYSLSVLKMVMDEINETDRYQIVKIINK